MHFVVFSSFLPANLTFPSFCYCKKQIEASVFMCLSCSDTSRHFIIDKRTDTARNWRQFVKLTELTIYKRMGNFNFRLINVSLCPFIYISTLQYLDYYIYSKPCKIRLPFYSLACGIGVGLKM